MRIVFWQNLLAFYQVLHMKGLSQLGHSVVWVSQEDISSERRSHGWELPDLAGLDVIVAPNEDVIQTLVHERPQDSIHIFSGISGFPLVEKAFKECIKTSARIGVLIENRDDRGLKGLMRLIRYRVDNMRYRSRVSFVLVMGYGGKHGGWKWYRRSGYRDEVLFPYGYFVAGPEHKNVLTAVDDGPVELLYIGQLVNRKGIDILLKALALLKQLSWRLKLVGDGQEKEALIQLGQSLGIQDRIEYMPYLKNREAMAQMAKADLFLLPSRFDGWGVVVNEALLRGVPVVCSDRCGAQDLLNDDWRGETFISESVSDLSRVLKKWISKGKKTPETVARLNRWNELIDGTSPAKYLCEVLENVSGKGPRPTPPWMNKHILSTTKF